MLDKVRCVAPTWTLTVPVDMVAPFTPEDAVSPAFRHKHHLPSFEESYGAIFIGTFVTLVLYGLSLEQTYRYVSLSWARDALILKFIVIGLFVTDTFHCAFIMHMCYHYLVTDLMNPFDLLFLTWSLKLLPLVTGANFLFAQSFYLRRIYLAKFGYRALISSIIVTLMLIEVVLIIITTVETIMQDTFIKKVIIERVTTALSYDVAIVVDCSLTGALVAILRKNRTVFKETNNILTSLALYAVIASMSFKLFSVAAIPIQLTHIYLIHIATLTTLSTIPITISTLIRPHNFIWIALTMPATKVYTISVLTMLNLHVL
ncbi:hypothetical protein C8Q74DRAFT_859280 [Fomes fomentarius]|nr:hypothetical protein C8Q74DRAFT_859280 [Fomes fomentarius]